MSFDKEKLPLLLIEIGISLLLEEFFKLFSPLLIILLKLLLLLATIILSFPSKLSLLLYSV